MGRFGLGERGRFRARPDPSNCRRAFFIMRKAVVAIRRRNTLSAVPLAIQKTADQANDPTCRRLQRFFVLTKGMSVVGPRSMILAEYDQIQARNRYGANDIRPGLTGWAQVNGRNGVTVEEKARLDGEYRR